MRRQKQRNWKKWGMIGFVILLLILSFRYPPIGNSIRGGFHVVFSPVERFVSGIGSGTSNFFYFSSRIFSLQEENDQLRLENKNLQLQLDRMRNISTENQRLSELLAFKTNHANFSLVPGKVTSREGGYWSSSLTIDQGTEKGIQKDMPVIDGRGLIGIVRESWDGGARVQLLTDPRYAVGAIVQRSGSRVNGILEGNNANPGEPRLVNLPSDADIQVGDQIITSGLGEFYPEGILIGQITSVHKDEGGLLKAAWIEPVANLATVEEVFVLTRVVTDKVVKPK